jgi:tetratricopeptide (TPR) repeat protein
MRGAVALGCLLGALALPLGAGAQQVQVDPPTLRQIAFEAVEAGFAEDALEITDALLQRDPADASALTIRSQALRALGDYPAAIVAARRAWVAADDGPARFGAAMAMAAAQSSNGNRINAELWLRRAANAAPNDRAYALARRDFSYVQSRNPWRFVFDMTLAPSSNVNNGSKQDTLSLPGLPIFFEIAPESQALSGVQIGLGFNGTYRISPTGPNRQTNLTFGANVQGVVLSSEAKADAPDARASDYTLTTLEFGASHRRGLDAEARTVLAIEGTLGHNWYGGDDLSDYLRLGVSLSHQLESGVVLNFGVAADHVSRIDRPLQSSDRVEINAGARFRTGPDGNDALSLRLALADTASSAVETRNTAVSLGVSWQKAEPLAGIGLAASLSVEQRIYPDSRYAAGGREDQRVTAKLQMTFTEVDYLGFSPVLEVQATRNRSNAALYDSQAIGINLGITSTF